MNHPPQIGKNIQEKRKEKHISLDTLARRSGVSKSMLSQIEQDKTNPTIVTAWKIARALSMTVQELMENKEGSIIEIVRKNDAPVTTTADGLGYLRVVSPMDNNDNIEIYHVVLKPEGVNDSMGHSPNAEEFITVVKGRVKLIAGEHETILSKGDTAKYNADIRHIVMNDLAEISECVLVVHLPQ